MASRLSSMSVELTPYPFINSHIGNIDGTAGHESIATTRVRRAGMALMATVKRFAAHRPLRVGEVVEIRSLQEILATLDASGGVDGMPFMPEMAAYCGQRAVVAKRAHKTCDGHGNLRWLDDAVHLDGLRCNGSAHGGCQAKCLIYWKSVWLRRVGSVGEDSGRTPSPSSAVGGAAVSVGPMRCAHRDADGAVRYVCQATEVMAASRPLPATYAKQYLWDLSSGNWSIPAFGRFVLRAVFNHYQLWSAAHLPSGLRIRDGRPLGAVQGRATKTPKRLLGLEIGERVRIRDLADIEATLSVNNTNRGILFDSEMAARCGSSSTVIDRIERIVDDRTGRMIEMKSDCIMLDGIACRGDNRRLCSRGAYDYWREIWLERDKPQ